MKEMFSNIKAPNHLWNYRSLLKDITISVKQYQIVHYTNNISESLHIKLNYNLGSDKVSFSNFEKVLQIVFIPFSYFHSITNNKITDF